jgi:hypothetical protein
VVCVAGVRARIGICGDGAYAAVGRTKVCVFTPDLRRVCGEDTLVEREKAKRAPE